MDCLVDTCFREALDDLCTEHGSIRTDLDKAYNDWKLALGGKFSKGKFFSELRRDELKTGKWVLEVIELIESKKI